VGDSVADPVDQAAIDAVADDIEGRARLAAMITHSSYRSGSHVFTMTVAGDGETVSTDDQTRWYNPRFVVNHDPNTGTVDPAGGFTVDAGWNNDGSPDIRVFDEDFGLIVDTEGALQWLDPSTLEVVVSGAAIDSIEVKELQVELTVRVTDAEGVELASPFGDGCWTPS
jgi:hypothetical protein